MSVNSPATIQIRDNEWQGGPETGIARHRIQNRNRISGCTFEVEPAPAKTASDEGQFPRS